jgi:hypothetical protein
MHPCQLYAAVEFLGGSIANAQWQYTVHMNLSTIPDTQTLKYPFVLESRFKNATQFYSYVVVASACPQQVTESASSDR